MELERLKELSVPQFISAWSKYVESALELVQQALQNHGVQDTANTLESNLADAMQALKTSATICQDALHECHSNPPDALLNAAIQLHDGALLSLGDLRPDVQDVVAKLCCSWWQYEARDREYLVAQTLPYLLLRAISTQKPMHVKLCFVMRGALDLLDFDDESINDMKRMLLQAAICPAFVSRPEGRRFLACLLTVHPSMVQEMTSVIRNQIPAGRRSVLDAYGEVILRGWRDAVGPSVAEIETNLIQNLMLAAIHGSGVGLVGNIIRVLGELHRSKRLGGAGSVDSMLVRLYEPILFRALAAANAGVRRNALQLLLDAFPLLDPEASTEEQDELLVRQFQCLSDALTDCCPLIRVVAAQGICSVLNLYWEIIPSATTAGFVSRLTGQLAFDAALPAVRVAVLEGLQLLVDNQHAQPVLKRALPQLAPLIWDSSASVRDAMADLLLCISTSRGLHFWEVVPLEVLLAEMAEARSSHASAAGGVAQKLHQLLVPSYFPGPEEGVARVAALLKDNPRAGQRFCRLLVAPFIHHMGDGGKGAHRVQVPLEDILQLASAMMSYLLAHPPASDPRSPPRKQQRGSSRLSDRSAADGGCLGDPISSKAGDGKRGKRKKVPAAAHTSSLGLAAAAGAEAQQQDQDQDVDVLDVGAREESPESWVALLSGLAEICYGIGMALTHELCEEVDVQELFPEQALQQLLAACPNQDAEQGAWRIAEHLPCLKAAKHLLMSRLQLLSAGELQPGAPAAASSAVTDGPLVEAAAAAKADMLAVLAALLTAGSGTHKQPARSNRFAQQTAAGRQLLLNDDDWLPMIVQTAAQAEEIELVCTRDAAHDGDDDEDARDAENLDPNTTSATAAAGKKGKNTRSLRQTSAAGMSLPPVLSALVAAANQLQVQQVLSGKCLKMAITSAQEADWDSSIGALRLSCLFGCRRVAVGAAEADALLQLKAQAQDDNGTAAHLVAEHLAKLMTVE
eukprot:gene6481-6708_t